MRRQASPADLPWLDALEEGVLLIEEGCVQHLNRAAVLFLDVELEQARGMPLIAVLRDHRLEQAYLQQQALELETRGRILVARAIPGGLALRDITAQRQAEENARELLAVLSHELRTPVTLIRSTLEALHYELPEAQRKRFVNRAEAETERLVRLLEDLTVDVKPPQLRRLDLIEVITRALNLLQETFETHGVSVEVAASPLTVWADSDKLLQVLINLLENAAVHGPDGGKIHLLAEPNSRGNMACVSVRDEGQPLSAEKVEELFEPHARGVSVKARGTGLGLYIVRSIAQRWDGRAWGRPLEHGNEFGFSVPLR